MNNVLSYVCVVHSIQVGRYGRDHVPVRDIYKQGQNRFHPVYARDIVGSRLLFEQRFRGPS